MGRARVAATAAAMAAVIWLVGLGGRAAALDIAAVELEATTPPRLSYVFGAAAFLRPGEAEALPASPNIALAPGDLLSTGDDGTVELQVGPGAFLRVSHQSRVVLERNEAGLLRFRIEAGHASLDVASLPVGQRFELVTQNATLSVADSGYYRVQSLPADTVIVVRRAGRGFVAVASGPLTEVASGEEAIIAGIAFPYVRKRVAPAASDWDRWNEARTAALRETPSAVYVSPGVYGLHDLDQHGAWTTAAAYGPVWVPRAVPAGWAPYSTGRWIWDPVYRWTWVDDASWGWAPYHHGRWVVVHGVWAWAPGPVAVRSVYLPALVAFLRVEAPVRPVGWVALGWAEPLIPWWGPTGFAGVPSWVGWAGPRTVNGVVVRRTTVVDARHVTVYSNAKVQQAVIIVPQERFGRGHVAPARLVRADVARLTVLHEPRHALQARPIAPAGAASAPLRRDGPGSVISSGPAHPMNAKPVPQRLAPRPSTGGAASVVGAGAGQPAGLVPRSESQQERRRTLAPPAQREGNQALPPPVPGITAAGVRPSPGHGQRSERGPSAQASAAPLHAGDSAPAGVRGEPRPGAAVVPALRRTGFAEPSQPGAPRQVDSMANRFQRR